ncbi:MAG: PEP/pyruvate-binding domain-containing protein [Myxococcaceae bacterium]
MPNRVREILLVSSPYDAFTLEEDGRLTERIFTEYSELNLSSAPRITHVSTGARAMEVMAERRFDLVLTMARIADTDVSAFGRKVKAAYPNMPVVLLVLTEADLSQFPGGVDPSGVDHVFWWTGDARILLAIIKLVEDTLNAPQDTRKAGVRVIIVVEDSVRRYSSFLSLLYAELMTQSNSLVYEGVNELHRLMRMRARPKLLLAKTYEQAMALFKRYREYVIAVISDVRFPRSGEEDRQAGFDLIRAIRADEPELALMLQSAEAENAAKAAELGVHYADKNSPDLLKQIRTFVTESLGFGDFIFRLPDRTEVGRARDLFELEALLRTVPAASVELHATRNHFSLWLMARSMFALAGEVRPRTPAEFGGTENLRTYLIKVLEESRRQQQEGVITDFSSKLSGPEAQFVRMGKGSIGGKARGLAFVSSIIARNRLRERFEGLQVRVPRSVVIPTDEFDKFMESNKVLENGLARTDAAAVLARCLAGRLSDNLMRDLPKALAEMHGPLAVRSSSLLEDSQLQPFAGIYSTYMLPNNHPDPQVRLTELCQAIKAVYASTYSEDARAYIGGTPYSIEEEKMAVLVQEMVGKPHGTRFYPHAAGVAVSYNYYPVGHQRAEDGLAMVALGLGQTIVQGGAALQFSPNAPGILPQFGSAQDYLRFSQSKFYALDMTRPTVDFLQGADASLAQYELSAAEEDSTLSLVGSVYNRDDDTIRDNLNLPGARVVTFHNILKYEAIPLAPALATLLKLFTEGMGGAVEIEFALDGGDWGRAVERGKEPEVPSLYVLQVRPQATQALDASVETGGFGDDEVLCRTDRALGHGAVDDLRDIVFVKRQDLGAGETPAVAAEVGAINARLQAEKRPYLLVGPGRWGSSDSRLGIPVKWAQIAGAKVIVETNFADREVEPSQGAHFFHNVTSFRIGYLTLSHLDRRDTADRRQLDQGWFERQPTFFESPAVRHLRLERPLRVRLDGRKGVAVILKPS